MTEDELLETSSVAEILRSQRARAGGDDYRRMLLREQLTEEEQKRVAVCVHRRGEG
jgi:hypothetical protein